MSDLQKNNNLQFVNPLTPSLTPTSTPSTIPIDIPWYSNFMILTSVIIAGLCLLSFIIGLIAVATGSLFKNKNSTNDTFAVDNPMHSKGGYFYLD
jgi:hypothetical protein